MESFLESLWYSVYFEIQIFMMFKRTLRFQNNTDVMVRLNVFKIYRGIDEKSHKAFGELLESF